MTFSVVLADANVLFSSTLRDYVLYAADEGAIEMEAKDRHVLAAALSADADILLTDNIKDFPAQRMAGQGIELLTAGQLLPRLAEDFPDKMRAAHEKTVRYSPKPEAAVLATLEATAGKYAADAI